MEIYLSFHWVLPVCPPCARQWWGPSSDQDVPSAAFIRLTIQWWKQTLPRLGRTGRGELRIHWGIPEWVLHLRWKKKSKRASWRMGGIWAILARITEKAVAPHSSTLAWKIPWTEEPGRLQSMGSRRVRHDWVTSLSVCTFMHWRRKWQPTPVLLPGKSQGGRSLVGCGPWGR